MIAVAQHIWPQSLAHFRRCGAGRRECVVYWTAALNNPDEIDAVVHPRHAASIGHYELDSDWLQWFWVDLHRQKRTIRVQVHTHAGAAFHSATDDRWPIVHVPSFLSLVVPNFGRSFQNADLYLAEIDPTGHWEEVDFAARIGDLP